MTPREVLPEHQWSRSYRRRMATAVGTYLALLSVSLVVLGHLHGWSRYPVAVAPAGAFGSGIWVVAKHLRQIDEMHRDQLLRQFAFGFAGTALVTFTYGLAEIAGAPRLSMLMVWPLMGLFWIAGGALNRG